MTGNTVLLGIALAQLRMDAAARSGLALAGFFAGAGLAAWLVERDRSSHPWPAAVTAALALEGLVLAAFALGGALRMPPAWLIVFSAVAMGMQSAAVYRLEVSGITTTYITGTLTRLAADLMPGPRHRRPAGVASGRLLAGVWAIYLCGAATGAVIPVRAPALVLALPAALVLLIAAAAALAYRRRSTP